MSGPAVEEAAAHQKLIDELWDFDDPEASLVRLEAAAETHGPGERPILLTQVARAMGLGGRYDEALALLDTLPFDGPEVRVRVNLERGRVLNSAGSPSAARSLFESSFSLAESAGFEFLAIDALHMLANVAPAEDRVVLNERALALATAAKDPRAREWRASLLNNLGWARFDGGDFAAALRLFSDAAGERERQGNAREIGVARWCVGRTLRALGRTEEALETQVELAAWLSSVGLSDSYVEEEIGECLSELDREEEARHHFGQAARLLAAGGPGEIADPKRLAALQSRATATSVYTSTTPEPTSG